MSFFKSRARTIWPHPGTGNAGQSFTSAEYGVAKTGVHPVISMSNDGNVEGGLLVSLNAWLTSNVVRPCKISFYKNQMPSRVALDSLTNSQVLDFQTSNRLLSTTSNSQSYVSGIYSASFPTANAENNGDISWFMLHFRTDYSDSQGDPRFIYGSVGLVGSGADIEMEELSVEVGSLVVIPAFTMPGIPLGFEFD